MTKKELLENEAFNDAYIEIPNARFQQDFDEREEVTISVVEYWDFKNQINLW